ncbi:MAG: thiamine phosphate synthase [Ponticaulis sp.]|nr:thiamine phosphate synthase [Ponticaulis sp.]|tara:strand:- start:8019 stop:8669 length:651 start_codon:yes stop_codon:yes gene_type:complete
MSYRCRLYLITPPVISDLAAFEALLDDALAGGDVACLQIRLKSEDGVTTDADATRRVGKRIIEEVQARDIAVLINDRADLAAELGADGVHIGQTDMSFKEAKNWVGESGIVGVTCHDSRHLAMVAGEQGADYVAFGAFYPTETKSAPTQAEPELLTWWQEMMEIPCVAIGGIKVDNAEPVVKAGADFLAVSGGVWSHPEGPAAAVRQFNEIFDQHE